MATCYVLSACVEDVVICASAHRECFLREGDKEAALEAFEVAQNQDAALKPGAITAFITAAKSTSDGV